MGIEQQFVQDAVTEEDWVDVMDRVRRWELGWEDRERARDEMESQQLLGPSFPFTKIIV